MVRAWPFDVILNHNRFTLLNRSANELHDYAAAHGIAIMNAAPYASGVLAKGSTTAARMTYREVDQAELAPVRRLEAACLAHGVPLGAAALQFSLRDPRITTTVVGVSRPERIAQTVEWAKTEISEGFWSALDQIPYLTDDPQIWAD
jgi:D-threo-aldose 1-dehydrogenase